MGNGSIRRGLLPLTLEDAVEFFNIVSGGGLTLDEKAALVSFLRVL
jgi:hypothetical protein